MKLTVLLLTAFASASYAGVIGTDISDRPPSPLEFMMSSIWTAHPLSSNFLAADYSIDGSTAAHRAIQSSESITALTAWDGDLTLSGLAAPHLGDWSPDAGGPSFQLLSGLTFMADSDPQPQI